MMLRPSHSGTGRGRGNLERKDGHGQLGAGWIGDLEGMNIFGRVCAVNLLISTRIWEVFRLTKHGEK